MVKRLYEGLEISKHELLYIGEREQDGERKKKEKQDMAVMSLRNK